MVSASVLIHGLPATNRRLWGSGEDNDACSTADGRESLSVFTSRSSSSRRPAATLLAAGKQNILGNS